LQGVCPYDCLDAAFVGVYPHEGHGADGNHPERDVHILKYVRMQDQTDKIQFGCRSQHTGEQEEERAGAVGMHTDACAEISVDTRQIQSVVKRQQYVCYDHIAEEESEYGLHIRHVHSANHARYGYESHAGNCSANHAEGDYIPG
jgi:hypothetical protein